MARSHIFKVGINLFLLVVLCATQIAAVPNDGSKQARQDPLLSMSSHQINNTIPVPQENAQQTSITAGDTVRVSLSSNGEQGNDESRSPSISADGRYVAFHSDADNLVGGDTNERTDVFVYDTHTQTVERISVATDGTQADASSSLPSISADGRYVAFESTANNLVAGDINVYMTDVFLHDRWLGSTTLVSVSSNGAQGFFHSEGAALSADGRYVAFSSGSKLVSDDTNETYDTFVHDMQTGTTKRVSVNSDGTQQNGWSNGAPTISADGRYVAFESDASNLISDDTNGMSDVFRHDTQTGQTILISVASDGGQGNSFSAGPHISNDGRYVAFSSAATNLVSGNTYEFYEFTDVFVRDTQMNTTSRISVDSDGTEGNGHSFVAVGTGLVISENGRYVVFFSDASNLIENDVHNGTDIFIHDRQTGATTLTSVASDGTQGNSGSMAAVFSADGNYMAFMSYASNLVSGDTNGSSDIFVRGSKFPVVKRPPLILVHGWQGLALSGGYDCTNDSNGANDIERFERYDDTHSNSTLKSDEDRLALADWLSNDYEVWIAHLKTSPLGTPPLETNAKCLRDQIEHVYSQNPQPITMVAHSMGGLVSRAAIRNLDSEIQVKALYTLGSPHAGIPFETFIYVIGPGGGGALCLAQSAVCQMTPTYMSKVFNKNNPNLDADKTQYSFIGGDGGSGSVNWLLKKLGQGSNDGLVGQYSAVGWNNPDQIFTPDNWPFISLPHQYFTDETHPAQSDSTKAYYVFPSDFHEGQTGSDSYECMRALMNGRNPDSQYCHPADAQPSTQDSTLSENSPTQVSLTEVETGHLDAGQAVTLPFETDSVGATLFHLSWSGGNAPYFTLIRPDMQGIDPVYALAHPEEVSYETADGSPESAPNTTYNLISGQVGTWQVTVTATDAIDYKVLGLIESTLLSEAETDADVYQSGDVATITANLVSGGTGLSGATVTATLTRPDTVVDVISLTDQGNGIYTNTYTIPDAPGYITIEVNAAGSDNGTTFSRQENLSVAIASDDLQPTGNFDDQPRDDNSDGLYDYLDFTAGVNLATAGEYAVSAELYAGDQLVTQSGDFFNLVAGIQTITLPFDGGAIYASGLNGPYTIKNLYMTPIDIGITAVNIETAWTTDAYSFTQFGLYPCYVLTLGHTGSGANPAALPPNSSGCPAGEYAADEIITLTASPSPGWAVSGWTETDKDASLELTNSLVMPASNHTAGVNYFKPAVPGTPALLSPAIGALVDTLTPILDWRDSSAAHHYQVQLATNTSFTALLVNETNALSSTFTPPFDLTPGELYYWRVKAFNVIGGASGWSLVRTFKTPLAQAALTTPANGAPLTVDRPSFAWDSVDGANQYNLQVSAVSNFSTLFVNATTNSPAYTMTKDLPQNKTLYWRVRTKTLAVMGPWSAKWTFKTGNPPTVPVLVAPLNNALVKNYTPELNWSNSKVPAGTAFKYYEVQLDDNKEFSSPESSITTEGQISDSDFTPLTDLAANTRYYWRVRALNTITSANEDHTSGWSTVWSFRAAILPPSGLSVTQDPLKPRQPTFEWDDASGVFTSYTIQVSTVSNFSTLLVNSTTQDSFYAMAKNLPTGKTLYWRVRVNGANGPSAWTKSQFALP